MAAESPYTTSALGQKAFVEAIGVFLLTFIGAGSIIATQYLSSPGNNYPGLIVVAFATALPWPSPFRPRPIYPAATFNPAVTVDMLVTHRISGSDALVYIISQILGAAIAGYVLFAVYPSWGNPVLWGRRFFRL